MNVTTHPAITRLGRRLSPKLPYQIVELALIALLASGTAKLIWALFAPIGPVGAWKATTGGAAKSDESLLARFDPFFRAGAASGGPAVVTSLPVKLFGVRVDEAMGRGSAIIATPDGVQSSFAVGDEILPGVKLKSVSFDGVTVERGGVDEQIFLDQSVKAPIAGPQPANGMPVPPTISMPSPPVATTPLANEIAFVPRAEKGEVTGFVVSPKGSGAIFSAMGLKEGDVLKSINGQAIRAANDVGLAIAAVPPSGQVMLSVERGGRTISLTTKARP